jgi:hypothetical protein
MNTMQSGMTLMREWLDTYGRDAKLDITKVRAMLNHFDRLEKQLAVKYLDIVRDTITKHESITIDEVVYEIDQIKAILR